MKSLLEQVMICNFASSFNKFWNTKVLSRKRAAKFEKNKSKFNGAYSRNNLPKIMDGTHVINLDEYKSIGLIG